MATVTDQFPLDYGTSLLCLTTNFSQAHLVNPQFKDFTGSALSKSNLTFKILSVHSKVDIYTLPKVKCDISSCTMSYLLLLR